MRVGYYLDSLNALHQIHRVQTRKGKKFATVARFWSDLSGGWMHHNFSLTEDEVSRLTPINDKQMKSLMVKKALR